MSLIKQKWSPLEGTPRDGLSLTRHRKERNTKAEEENGALTFDPSVTSSDDVSELFRAFVDPARQDDPPAMRPRTGIQVDREAAEVHLIEISHKQPKVDRVRPPTKPPSFVAFFGKDYPRNALFEATRHARTRNVIPGELVAALYAARTVPNDAPLHLVSPSRALRDILFHRLRGWEDKGWIGVEYAEYTRALIGTLRGQCAVTTLRSEVLAAEWSWIDRVRDTANTEDPQNAIQRREVPPR